MQMSTDDDEMALEPRRSNRNNNINNDNKNNNNNNNNDINANTNNRKGSGTAWQNLLTNPGQRLSSLHRNPKLADLTISFPGHDNITPIKAHRLVLAMSSPVFEAMLFGPLAEGPEIQLHDDPPEAFEWFLEHIYKGQNKLPDVNQAVQIYQLATKYQVEPLMKLCSNYLQSSLTPTNLPEMYDTAVLLEDDPLLQQCTKVVNRSPKTVLNSPSFGRLSRSALAHLLQNPLHIPSEVILFDALVKWGRSHTNRSSLREEIKDFLPKVRFLVMSTDDFVEHVMPSGVLSLEEMSDILMNIKLVTNIPLPPLCSSIREKRKLYVESLMRTLTLTTLHRHPKHKRGSSASRSSGSFLVHSTHEQMLVRNLRSNTTFQLGRIECKVLHPISGSAIVTIRDENGGELDSALCEAGSPQAQFKNPVTIEANSPHSITVCMEGQWPKAELGEFKASNEEIQVEGNIAYTELRSGTVVLRFWAFD